MRVLASMASGGLWGYFVGLSPIDPWAKGAIILSGSVLIGIVFGPVGRRDS